MQVIFLRKRGTLFVWKLQVYCAQCKTETEKNKYIVNISSARTMQSSISGQGQRSLRSCHERGSGHHILYMYIFPELLIYGMVQRLWLHSGHEAFTSAVTLRTTAWPAGPGFAFHWTSLCTKPQSSRKWLGLSHGKRPLRLESPVQGILSLWYIGDILFLLFNWPSGSRVCPGTRPDLYLAHSADVLVMAWAGGQSRTVSACMHTSCSCTIMGTFVQSTGTNVS